MCKICTYVYLEIFIDVPEQLSRVDSRKQIYSKD